MSQLPSRERERQRLEALAQYEIVDTPTEAAFDEVAQLAADLCGTPIALVTVLDQHRQFFKAEVGAGFRETSVADSFCIHAIEEDDFLEVTDATEDPRFSDNPLVTGDLALRFYAGALLKTPTGVPIGTLCVLDRRPRALSEVQQRALKVLANQVMGRFEMQRAIRVSIGVRKGPPIGVQKGPPSSSSLTGMTGAPFALVAA